MNLKFYKNEKKHKIDKNHNFNFDWNADLKLNMKHDLDHMHLKKLNEWTAKFFLLRISDVNREYCNRTDSVSRYDDLMKHLSWISIAIKIDERNQDD